MLDIYSSTFMTATRTHETCLLHEVPPSDMTKRRRWFNRRRRVCVDLTKL